MGLPFSMDGTQSAVYSYVQRSSSVMNVVELCIPQAVELPQGKIHHHSGLVSPGCTPLSLGAAFNQYSRASGAKYVVGSSQTASHQQLQHHTQQGSPASSSSLCCHTLACFLRTLSGPCLIRIRVSRQCELPREAAVPSLSVSLWRVSASFGVVWLRCRQQPCSSVVLTRAEQC